MTEKTQEKPEKAKTKVPVLQVHSKRGSYRRANIQFGPEAATLPIKSLKREQIDAIKADPNLVVVETAVEVETD